MKGALLVLALLVTRELTFKTHEACPVFFETLSAVGLGLPRKALNATLDSIDANEAERAALGRIWDCFIDPLVTKSVYMMSQLTQNRGLMSMH
uniref:Uncharacterized protein n=1 Tax=Capra hircus TaxID=9925 RepID=A0A8C2PAE0_CAPHI